MFLQVKQRRFLVVSQTLSSALTQKPECGGSCHLCTCSSLFCANLDVCTEVKLQNKDTGGQMRGCARLLSLPWSCNSMTEVRCTQAALWSKNQSVKGQKKSEKSANQSVSSWRSECQGWGQSRLKLGAFWMVMCQSFTLNYNF